MVRKIIRPSLPFLELFWSCYLICSGQGQRSGLGVLSSPEEAGSEDVYLGTLEVTP